MKMKCFMIPKLMLHELLRETIMQMILIRLFRSKPDVSVSEQEVRQDPPLRSTVLLITAFDAVLCSLTNCSDL